MDIFIHQCMPRITPAALFMMSFISVSYFGMSALSFVYFKKTFGLPLAKKILWQSPLILIFIGVYILLYLFLLCPFSMSLGLNQNPETSYLLWISLLQIFFIFFVAIIHKKLRYKLGKKVISCGQSFPSSGKYAFSIYWILLLPYTLGSYTFEDINISLEFRLIHFMCLGMLFYLLVLNFWSKIEFRTGGIYDGFFAIHWQQIEAYTIGTDKRGLLDDGKLDLFIVPKSPFYPGKVICCPIPAHRKEEIVAILDFSLRDKD